MNKPCKNKQRGLGLVETLLVLAVGSSILVLSTRMYRQWKEYSDVQQLSSNVEQLFGAMNNYYNANCRKQYNSSGTAVTQGMLDPSVIGTNTTWTVTINSTTTGNADLYTLGLLSNTNWHPANSLVDNAIVPDQGYYLQFNRFQPSNADPTMSIKACAGNSTNSQYCTNSVDALNPVSATALAGASPTTLSKVVYWTAQVAVKIPGTGSLAGSTASLLRTQLNATCITDSPATTCANGALSESVIADTSTYGGSAAQTQSEQQATQAAQTQVTAAQAIVTAAAAALAAANATVATEIADVATASAAVSAAQTAYNSADTANTSAQATYNSANTSYATAVTSYNNAVAQMNSDSAAVQSASNNLSNCAWWNLVCLGHYGALVIANSALVVIDAAAVAAKGAAVGTLWGVVQIDLAAVATTSAALIAAQSAITAANSALAAANTTLSNNNAGVVSAQSVLDAANAALSTAQATLTATQTAYYLVWERPATMITQNMTPPLWLSSPMLKQFNMQYTNDGMSNLSGVLNPTSNIQNYLCGG